MTDKGKTVLQRLSEAAYSSDLSHRRTVCDVDWEHALGVAGVRNRIGSALLALDMTLDQRDVPAALKAAMSLVQKIALKRGWSMHALKRRRIAEQALRHYIAPGCSKCKGRGMLNVERDNPADYHPKPCDHCHGSGLRPIQAKHRREITEVLYVMNARRIEASQQVRRAMGLKCDIDYS